MNAHIDVYAGMDGVLSSRRLMRTLHVEVPDEGDDALRTGELAVGVAVADLSEGEDVIEVAVSFPAVVD